MRSLIKAALAFLGVVTCMAPANAATLLFNYTFVTTGRTLSGSVEGTLAGDGNRLVVTALNGLSVDGVAVSRSFAFVSADAGYLNATADPTLSLDGSYLDFLLFDPSENGIYLVLATGNQTAAAAQANFGPAFATGLGSARVVLGGNDDQNPYVRIAYSAQLAGGAVPEPATWGMMILGFGMVGATLRRRSVMARFA